MAASNVETNGAPANGGQTNTKVLSPTTLAKAKRRLDGATHRVESSKEKIAKLKARLDSKTLTLSQRRNLRNSILKAEKSLVQAFQDYKKYDREYRDAVYLVIKRQKNDLAGLRYEGKMLPKFEAEFVPNVEGLMKKSAAENVANSVERQIELVGLAGSDERSKFNKKFGELLKDLDAKLFVNVDRTKTLKRKLQASMFKFFLEKHENLPQNSFEEDEFRRNNEHGNQDDRDVEVENETHL